MPVSGRIQIQDEHLAMTLGALKAVTEATSAGIQALSAESATTTNALTVAVTTLGMMEKTVTDLVRLVRDGNGQEALVTQIKMLRLQLVEITRITTAQETAVAMLQRDVDELKSEGHVSRGRSNAILIILTVVGWFVTVGIAGFSAWAAWRATK